MENVHNKPLLYHCWMCGKGFDSNKCLKQHMQKHDTQERGVIKCANGICQQKFTSGSDLKKHLETHSKKTPSHSKVASRLYSSIKQKHVSTKQFPYTCDYPGCMYSSKTDRALVCHKRRMHTIDLWTCHLCGEQFKNRFHGLSHVSRAHKVMQVAEISPIQGPGTAVEQQKVVCKDEIEEVVFD